MLEIQHISYVLFLDYGIKHISFALSDKNAIYIRLYLLKIIIKKYLFL